MFEVSFFFFLTGGLMPHYQRQYFGGWAWTAIIESSILFTYYKLPVGVFFNAITTTNFMVSKRVDRNANRFMFVFRTKAVVIFNKIQC